MPDQPTLPPTTPEEPATYTPKTARGEQTRQRLLDAAERVFGARGYHAASIVDITREAGVAMGTFYIYFPDKKAVFDECVRHLNRRLRAHLREATAGVAGGRLEVERAALLAFFAFVQEHRDLYRIIRQAEFVDEALFRWHYQTLAQGYVRGLEAAMARGEIRRLDPEALAYCLMAIVETYGMRWLLWEGRYPPPEAVETATALLAHGLTPAPTADCRLRTADDGPRPADGGPWASDDRRRAAGDPGGCR